jgi:hypothetical protein
VIGRDEVAFEIERFERVTAGSGALLLRVSGRWRAHAPLDLGPASLRVNDGRTTHWLEALPGPDATTAGAGPGGRPWRAAFAAPAELVSGSSQTFSLHVGDAVVELPPPVDHTRTRTPVERERDDARAEAHALRAQVDELRLQLEALGLSALDAQSHNNERVEAAQAEASVERARAERLEEELAQARSDLSASRDAVTIGRARPLAPRQPVAGNGNVVARARRAVPAGPPPGSLPAEWLVALMLLGVGVLVVLVVWIAALL